MFLVKTTGVNTCYGKKNEITTIADQFLKCCLKYEWIYPRVYYLGKQTGKSYKEINKLIQQNKGEVN